MWNHVNSLLDQRQQQQQQEQQQPNNVPFLDLGRSTIIPASHLPSRSSFAREGTAYVTLLSFPSTLIASLVQQVITKKVRTYTQLNKHGHAHKAHMSLHKSMHTQAHITLLTTHLAAICFVG
jgi:hypothetical protein